MRPLQLNRNGGIMTPSDATSTVALTTSGQAIDVPGGAQFGNFSANADFYLAAGSTAAAVPTATTTASSTNSELNPTIRDFHSTAKTTGISVIAPVAGGILTIGWFGP